jgi:predicted DNA binding CopG/RHH family protein
MTKDKRITFRVSNEDVEIIDLIKLMALKIMPSMDEISDSEALRMALRLAAERIELLEGE